MTSVSDPRVTRKRPLCSSTTVPTASSSERTCRHSTFPLDGCSKIFSSVSRWWLLREVIDRSSRAGDGRWAVDRAVVPATRVDGVGVESAHCEAAGTRTALSGHRDLVARSCRRHQAVSGRTAGPEEITARLDATRPAGRGIAHDRRGHGRSSQTWGGNDMDTYVADLASLIENLDLRDVILVGHSTGG